MAAPKTNIEVTSEPNERDLKALGDSLAAFNDADVGPSGKIPIAVFVRDDAGTIRAGVSGYTAWGWLFTQWLWVDEGLRGRNVAGEMLAAAEAEAVKRGCNGAWIDTFSPVALRVYVRAGYSPFGALEDFPKGRTRTFLQKKL
jgi:GNAT superfamily N-acetyltransferase